MSNVLVTIRTLATAIRDITGSRKEIVFSKAKRQGDPMCWRADNSRIRTASFEKIDVLLQQGLAGCWEWFCNQG